MLTLEEEIAPQLRVLFKQAGAEITLRTLVAWLEDQYQPGHGYILKLSDALRQALASYESRNDKVSGPESCKHPKVVYRDGFLCLNCRVKGYWNEDHSWRDLSEEAG